MQIKSTQPGNVLEIRWAPNNVCNYKCAYCFPGANAGTHLSPVDLPKVVKNMRYMFDQYQKQGKTEFHLKISGGEPTLWSSLGEFIYQIKQTHNVYVSLVTNASRTLRWWGEYGSMVDNLIVSYHQKESNLNHISTVGQMLVAMGKKVSIHVLMDPTCWDDCVHVVDHLATTKTNWFVSTKEIDSTTNNTVTYTDEQRAYLQKETKKYPGIIWLVKNIDLITTGKIRRHESCLISNGKTKKATSQYYITHKLNQFHGWHCQLGVEGMYIHWTGEITGSCGQRIAGNNILHADFVEKFTLPNGVVCNQLQCNCPPETHISKVAPS
jgi:organic radical activating enzyme